ncbi:mammaglobin-A-like [Tenrec ecaudatus]|uniref:mammaglobin-A-like n=1 Tax=Tenrec ecaudatus TaxID=94439 RepID=UPI003F5A1EFE
MKLVMVLVLVALPLYCYAGSGCPLLERLINETISSEISVDNYVRIIDQEAIMDDNTRESFRDLKQCYLDQPQENLDNIMALVGGG